MILPDFKIRQWAEMGGLAPFEPDHVNPASVDLALGESYTDLLSEDESLLLMGEDGLTLRPQQAILATTVEYIKLPGIYAGCVYLTSTMAREGLDHALAGWVDPGFEGQLTLEFHTHRPITLIPGQRIVQLVLWIMQMEPDSLYNGRYQGQRGPTRAREQIDYAGGKIATFP